ncbi:hypothetical protein FQA39_LY04207 [Lamprigera yunnana]|nr:hypothetical protein FQA39_LY04207 [Lamprigera yunnana]
MYNCFFAHIIILIQIKVSTLDESFSGAIPNLVRFPVGGPYMGIILAISVPLELPRTNVYFSYYFEANYNLPENQSTYEYPPIVSDRSLGINRKNVYKTLEFKINSHGYPGRECLLRTICEAAEFALDGNGVLGDIMHILLSPSSSKSENLPLEYEDAEKQGYLKNGCAIYQKKCPISLLSLITWLENADF